jgi:phenylacetate-CoA ligase
MLAKLKPDVLMADSAYCRALARLSEITEKSLSFRFVVTSSAVLDPSTRKFIGDKFQAEVYDHYGIEEVGGSIAWECPTHSGYHTNAESLLLEFLSNGEPVQAGEAGEVCVTSFHRIATPIIRYLDGDIAIQVNDECNCGRGLPLIREIQGRAMDFIASENGKYISPMAIVAALQNTPGVDQFKVTQREDYSIEIQAAIYRGDPEVVTQEVRRRCYLLFGIMPFNVSLVGKIEGSQGRKYRVVESHIGM